MTFKETLLQYLKIFGKIMCVTIIIQLIAWGIKSSYGLENVYLAGFLTGAIYMDWAKNNWKQIYKDSDFKATLVSIILMIILGVGIWVLGY